MDVAGTVQDYYRSLRDGDPLYPFFRESEATVKYGLSETLVGYEAVAAGLREQTQTTTDWQVQSRDLRTGTDSTAGGEGARGAQASQESGAGQGGACGWFTDDVFMAWTDTERRIRYEFETRWSGTVVEGEFATMHVSTTEAL